MSPLLLFFASLLFVTDAQAGNINKLAKPSLIPANWDAALAGDIVMQRLNKVSASHVKGAHDAEFVCIGERAYIVEHDNDVAPGHGAGAAMYCVLTVVNLKTMAVEETIPLARAGQVFANVTLPEAQVFVLASFAKTTTRCALTSAASRRRNRR
jgi:hypothetical protein